MGEVCCGGGGCPKYGDYNGNACAAGRLCAAWASRLSPPGVPPPAMGSIGVLFECSLVGDVPQIQVPGSITFPDACDSSTSVTTLNVCNTGNGNLEVNSITSDDPQFTITTPSSGYPVIISPDFCFPFQINFTPTSTGPQSATLTISSNDPANPSVDVAASGTVGVPIATEIGELNFGDTCTGDSNTQTVQVCNTGSCNLTVTDVDLVVADCDHLPIVNPPTTPLTISKDFCFDFEVEYEPNDSTPPTCSLEIDTDDPSNPTITFPITASVPAPDINVSIANSGNFGDVCSVDLKDLNLQVINQGACDLTISAINVTDVVGSNNFTIPFSLQFPLVLSPDAHADVPIRFDPNPAEACSDTNPRSADITIVSDDPDPAETNLVQNVRGIVPCPNATPKGQLDFGQLCIGDRKADTIEVCNTGKCNLT